MRDSRFLHIIRKYVLNKYVLVCVIFGVVFVFVGEQSILKGIQRQRQIRQTEQQIRAIRADIEATQRKINWLRSTDSLEQFAREEYYMHAPGEDVYIVKE